MSILLPLLFSTPAILASLEPWLDGFFINLVPIIHTYLTLSNPFYIFLIYNRPLSAATPLPTGSRGLLERSD